MFDYSFLYLLSPLHTGGTTQEGNLVGIARESHTNFPYIPSSSIRGRLRASVKDRELREKLFGNELPNSDEKGAEQFENLKQGDIWIGDGSILWIPIPSLSHGVVWISSPMLLRRWAKFKPELLAKIPNDKYFYGFKETKKSPVYLKDAILSTSELKGWENSQEFIPEDKTSIENVLVVPNRHCATLIQMSLWRQVKVNLTEEKSVKDGSFRYEEAIPPDTLMYFPWGINSAAKERDKSYSDFKTVLSDRKILQIGGQESLGRGFVQQWQVTQQVEQTV